MSLFSKLFGGGGGEKSAPKEAEAIEYEGFRIIPTPMKEGSQFRLSARIEKDFGDDTKTHQVIRADVLGDADTASEIAIAKAKQVIDELGDRLFG